MKKRDIQVYSILAIVIILIILGIYLAKKPVAPSTDKELIKCIADNSLIYSSSSCSACKYQKDLFGEYYNLINEIDCVYKPEKCQEANIKATPTWIINNQQIKGIQSIEKLKELTGC